MLKQKHEHELGCWTWVAFWLLACGVGFGLMAISAALNNIANKC